MDRKYKSIPYQHCLHAIALILPSTLVNTPLKAQIPPTQLPLPQDVQPSFPSPSPSPEIPQPLPPPQTSILALAGIQVDRLPLLVPSPLLA